MTLRIFIAKFETLVDINVIKLCILCKLNTKKWSTCVSLLSTCACKIWLKSVIGYRNFGKTAYGVIFMGHPVAL